MLYFDSPGGVGFSTYKSVNKTYNDIFTAWQNYQAIQLFYEKFPQFKKNDFWVTGESYGGIYVPFTA